MNSLVALSSSLPRGRSGILPILHGMLCDCGAWILSREQTHTGPARLVFEFPRDLCADIYSVLVSFGLELTPNSHRILTELCRCTPYLFDPPSRTVTVVDHASLDEATRYICSLEIVKANLHIRFVAQEILPDDGSNAA